MSVDWEEYKALSPHLIRFVSSAGGVHDVKRSQIDQAREMDPNLQIIAKTPEEWSAFVAEQRQIELRWSLRHTLTPEDRDFLSRIGAKFGEPTDWLKHGARCKTITSTVDSRTMTYDDAVILKEMGITWEVRSD